MTKTRKIFYLFFIFVFLAGFNIFISLTILKTHQQKKQIQNILAEISNQFKQSDLSLKNSQLLKEEIEIADGRVANLKAFFRKYNSPLYPYAEKIVEVSDKYHFDYRLIPAIAMQESNLCKYVPEDSYNCWGWGIYGDQILKFKSYEEAIETVGKGLKEHYIDKGLITASMIMKKYTPSSNGSWAHGVNTFLRALE